MQRRRLLLLALAGTSASAQTRLPPERLPAVNLRVEWRWRETQPPAPGAEPPGSVTLRAGSRDLEAGAVQHLVVLNGGSASLRFARTEPIEWVEVFATPRGTGGVVRQGFVEVAEGIELRPRWPGGSAPVMLDLVAESVNAQGTAPRPARLATQLQLPPGEWQVVLRSGPPQHKSAPGVLSSRDAERGTQRELQVRVLLE